MMKFRTRVFKPHRQRQKARERERKRAIKIEAPVGLFALASRRVWIGVAVNYARLFLFINHLGGHLSTDLLL